MWFEILPAAGAIFTCMTLGYTMTHVIPWLGYGKFYCRDINSNAGVQGFLRDERVTGWAYGSKGLESLPDKNASTSSTSFRSQ